MTDCALALSFNLRWVGDGCDARRAGPNQLFDLLLLETLAMAMEHVGGWGSWLRWT